MPVKIVALGGSLARPSTSLAAVKVALEGAADAGAEVELFDVRSLDLPMLNGQDQKRVQGAGSS